VTATVVGSGALLGRFFELRRNVGLLKATAKKLLRALFNRFTKPSIENNTREIADDDEERPRKAGWRHDANVFLDVDERADHRPQR
jgi:hypothetical protein